MKWFSPGVPVRTDKPGVSLLVTSVEAASDQLLGWAGRGPHWERAVKVCAAAMAGQATAQEARRCFRLAAKEAGMLIKDESASRRLPR
ncbi:DUF982 domain-containing protein [Mesorhizobium sp. M7A.F.Ca.MR.362.00.0.0]|uniref:DUF982 domain-containing protein n=1 Tax=Mesorhizobium sp. M7A.F.Ca.MR.362.00.0.0 TaxID=2496779 RepID=UPI000FD4C468|nr:DUF982 domain-containing protein [Mesorhizobium sp. M7A.F.Ca.MR.362.00.0.0]RUU76141.1 DUF982 domain-containing protein [Mesorhizobium sp. M7A.F.Ca.MR.362.00.0.0]RWN95403.1 MAG: DUF982 domain-containing protein [Mesorhizobium sp.]